jgi:cytochrome c biogenesis protein CcmG/thiol:disulfide interchange protein DsbE
MNEPDLLLELTGAPEEPARKRGLGPGSLLVLLAVVAVAAVIGVAFVRQQQTQPTSGAAPDFSITTFDGDTFRLSDLRGQVVVINFWASWCVPCREEAPALESIWQQYRDRGVVVLGVAYADLDNDSLAFMREFGITYPNGPDTGTTISDNLYHITGVPETFIIDQDGQVAEFVFGNVSERGLSASLDALLTRGEGAS